MSRCSCAGPHAAQQKQAALDATSQARQDMAMAEFNRYAGIDQDGAMIEQARAQAAGQAWSGAVRGAIDRRDLGMARSLLDQGASHFDATVSQGLTRDLDQVQVQGEASQVAKGVLDAQPAGAPNLDAALRQVLARFQRSRGGWDDRGRSSPEPILHHLPPQAGARAPAGGAAR